VLVACEESKAFSICLPCRQSCRIGCLSGLVRAILKLGFWVVSLAGGIEGYLHDTLLVGVCKPEGLGVGVEGWELGGGEPTESEALKPKESRGH
jgi:hypothetical protein